MQDVDGIRNGCAIRIDSNDRSVLCHFVFLLNLNEVPVLVSVHEQGQAP
jgi:hypothetical protein